MKCINVWTFSLMILDYIPKTIHQYGLVYLCAPSNTHMKNIRHNIYKYLLKKKDHTSQNYISGCSEYLV